MTRCSPCRANRCTSPGRGAAVVALAALLAGCAAYEAKPLDLRAVMPDSPRRIAVDPARMPLPELAAHRFDPGDGLDADEVAMLAVANNPQLRVARDDAGIARAQAFAAGLLPDPQLSITRDFPTNGTAGNTTGFGLGLSYDVGALLLRSAKRGAAQAQSRKVDLELLWQEWQVVSRARLLFVRGVGEERLMSILTDTRRLYSERYRRARRALEEGNATLEAVSADLTALQDVDRQINELARTTERNRLALNLLLGLAPQAKLDLVGGAAPPRIDPEKVRALLPQLARRRPDLLALQAGYQSQELRVRQAVLAQFPTLSVGLTRARDTSGLYTSGFGISLSLPLFDRNRGGIAIERATRQRLYDEFRGRLDTAYSQVEGILGEQALLEKQLAAANDAVAELEPVVRNADAARQAGNLSELSYVNLRAGLLRKRAEVVALEQQLLEQRVAIQTLAGSELPAPIVEGRAEP